MLHERLEKLRISRGLSKAELCRQIKMPQTTYSGWSLGTREPDLETISMFAKFYDVSVDYLITGSDGGDFKKKVDSLIEDYISLDQEDQKTIEDLIKRMKKNNPRSI